ncbi:MAG: D-sedoheptulose 7-phosphate isomerase [Magnetococcales bacterium]|nr:D-sedoheptulose 7-phosphate isomerase [Magnetococcales bacterium]
MIDIRDALQEHQNTIASLHNMIPQITAVAQRLSQVIQQGGKILWMGNGGSAADSQHLAAELIGRFTRERRSIASVALTTDSSILTAIGNDYGYDTIFARQIEGLATPQDAVIGLSTSGNSPNVLQGLATARKIGALTVGLAGRNGGQLVQAADLCLVVPSNITARIQEAHILIGHILCDWIEAEVARV